MAAAAKEYNRWLMTLSQSEFPTKQMVNPKSSNHDGMVYSLHSTNPWSLYHNSDENFKIRVIPATALTSFDFWGHQKWILSKIPGCQEV